MRQGSEIKCLTLGTRYDDIFWIAWVGVETISGKAEECSQAVKQLPLKWRHDGIVEEREICWIECEGWRLVEKLNPSAELPNTHVDAAGRLEVIYRHTKP